MDVVDSYQARDAFSGKSFVNEDSCVEWRHQSFA